VSITLSAGAARTGAEVATEIESAFEAAGAPATAQAVSFGQQWIESAHPIKVEGTACATLGFDWYQRTPSSVMATLTDHLGEVGTEGDWELIDSVSPVMTEGARKWIRNLAAEFAAAGILASFAFSMEVYNPPAAMRAKYLHYAGGVVAPGEDVFLNVPSHQMHFGARVRNYLKQMYKECADEVAAAGLPVVLQFGETQWWYFDNRLADTQGGMPFYDQETIDAFAAAKGHQIWPFTSNTDDPAGDPAHPNETADFLRDRIWSYCQDVISYVRAFHPAALFECLWPLDANQGKPGGGTYRRLLMHVNLPREWQNSSYGIKYFRCEGFDYDIWQKNATLMGQTIRFRPGETTRNPRVNFPLPGRRTALTVCHAMIMAITVVLPAPVASLSARRISSGLASWLALSRCSRKALPVLPDFGATSVSQIAVSTAST